MGERKNKQLTNLTVLHNVALALTNRKATQESCKYLLHDCRRARRTLTTFLELKLSRQSPLHTRGKAIFPVAPNHNSWRRGLTPRDSASVVLNLQYLKILLLLLERLLALLFRWDGLYLYMFSHV